VFGGGRIGVRGRDHRAPTLQVGRVTDSDGGGRVRVGGLELGPGGGATTPQLRAGEVLLVLYSVL
jgi:hypothetical protein